jgi:hypothetical protein
MVSLAAPAAAAPPMVTFEAFGPGKATTIDLDPSTGRIFDAALPFSRTVTLAPGTTLLQVVIVGSTDVNPGCRIKVNGQVLVEKPVGDDAHCVADISGMSFGDDAPPSQEAKGITYEVKGPGTALTITVADQPGQLLEVIGVPAADLSTNPGCRIVVDGVVRADKPNGSDGLCVVSQ